VGAVHVVARAAESRRLRVMWFVRRVSRRMHGGEILHRASARRSRSRVRTRSWRGRVVASCSATRSRCRAFAKSLCGVAMSRNPWFESVAEAQRRAQRRLPRTVYSALLAGPEAGVTYRDNTAAFAELGFAPRVGVRPGPRELS